ncbi:LOW QUALITY PROTEIN: TBC1 domain family member 17-like [Haliaeetus albicilla]|uniref:LOW QUALITY PROTEIN: TBC1 domain family member 17-like n=1 Tax=Haliaeetus albicilla TaxID=8969 RepID=UPI0037E9ABAE
MQRLGTPQRCTVHVRGQCNAAHEGCAMHKACAWVMQRSVHNHLGATHTVHTCSTSGHIQAWCKPLVRHVLHFARPQTPTPSSCPPDSPESTLAHAPPPGWRGGFRLALGELRGLRRSPPRLRRPFVVLLPRQGTCPPPLHFPRGGARKLLRLLGPRLRPCPRDPRLLLVTTPEDPGPPPHPPSPGIVTRLLQGPYAATVGGLSRLLGGPRGPAPGEEEAEPEPPFEVIACVTLGPRPAPPRGPPVTEEEWGRSLDAEGRSLDPEGLRERLFRGGLSPEVRLQGWWRLLGLRPWGGADAPGAGAGAELQWRSLSAGQQRRNRPLRRYRQRLERDLARCHPDLTVPERLLLHDILMTYCMYHFDLGYVRGMSEVLAPLLAVTPDEVEAFWGFCSIMEMVGGNFGPSREGLKRQLGQLGQLLRVVDPNLCDRLEVGGTLGCCSRWLQLRFQPHFGLQGTLRLWEVLWTGLPCPNFQLVLSCVLLEMVGDGEEEEEEEEEEGEEEESDRDEAPPRRWPALEADEALSRAEGLFLQLAAAPDLPPPLQELLGLGGAPPDPPPPTPGSPRSRRTPKRILTLRGTPPPFQGGAPPPSTLIWGGGVLPPPPPQCLGPLPVADGWGGPRKWGPPPKAGDFFGGGTVLQ